MDVRAIKHAAMLSEWGERIQLCRSSGKPVTRWCEENRIHVKNYYWWERLYMAEMSMKLQAPAVQQSEEAGCLVRIEPEKLPVAKENSPKEEKETSCRNKGMILRHGEVELELPVEMAIDQIAALVKALSCV